MPCSATCPACSSVFVCGVQTGACWCFTRPALPAAARTGQGCRCPACLDAIVSSPALSLPPIADAKRPALRAALRARLDAKTKPLGSLGMLEALAVDIGAIQDRNPPQMEKCAVALFAASHGAAHRVSAYPPDVTWQMVENFLAGGAAINVMARSLNVDLHIVNAGVDHEFGQRDGLIDAVVMHGTRDYTDPANAGAMTQEACEQALMRGLAFGQNLQVDALGFGEMGIGNTASASLLMHGLTGVPLAQCVGAGAGLDEAGVARKLALLDDALRVRPRPTSPLAWLATYGGLEIAMMAGAMLGAASRGTVLVIDGFIVSAALLVATRLEPNVRQYAVFAHRSAEQGHRLLLANLQAQALFDLGLRLGEGTGAALAMPLLRTACAVVRDMASFTDAGVDTATG
ncbi:nicotinate-nucleotide--dimethylbenzimidazole phosphoribosyltransferase [Pigmentiphaga aceris]|uniref:Nicotinate-nucleotide--dimethylbenzimidazole phosphoribosyltransferase n=1 Tax=Pigmentiphaga aceris TaxID=1940612 RepID=A0A5C0AU86_9BURK|nr:nicotinate-nucleotide--dimethylbenzimidazole phosphoribosyltransferase [Pigmentiphaga aceris]